MRPSLAPWLPELISEPTCGCLSGTLKLVSADPPPPDGGPACPGAPTRDPGNGDAERFSNVLSLADSRRVRSEPVHVDGARVGASNDTFTAGLRGLTAEAHRKVLQLTHTHTHTRTHTHAVCTNFASSFTHTSKRVNRAGCVCVCVCVYIYCSLSLSACLYQLSHCHLCVASHGTCTQALCGRSGLCCRLLFVKGHLQCSV